jgi:hypothetical protein
MFRTVGEAYGSFRSLRVRLALLLLVLAVAIGLADRGMFAALDPTPVADCPLTEGFDDINTLAAAGWVRINHSVPPGTTGWFQGNPNNFSSQSGAPNSYIAANFNNTAVLGTISNWLITPVQTLQNGAQLSFYTRALSTAFADRLQVRMSLNGASTDVGSTETDVGDFTTLLLDINPNYSKLDYPVNWTQFTVTLSGISTPTSGRLAFRYFVENAGQLGANSNYIGIDTVQFCSSGPTPSPTPTPVPSPSPSPTPCTDGPSYSIHMSPPGFGDDWGEPSIGVNWNSEQIFNGIPNGGTVMSWGGFGDPGFSVTNPNVMGLRVIFNDSVPTAPAATWEHTAPMPLVGSVRAFGDPILFTDRETGRTFFSQLEGLTPAGSTTQVTDDDGRTFTISEGSGLPSSIDHQTFGGGPFAPPLTGGVTSYKNAVYYCSQSVADATCSLSVDGGITFGPGVPIYTVNDCAGLHGHIKVSPKDGTAYIPNKGCGGDLPFHHDSKQAVIVSENNGLTWQIRPVTTSTGNGNGTKSDPSIGVATDGTLYFGYQANDGHPRIAVSKDKGQTWINDRDVGAALGIQTALFPAVVAGDPDRAAFAFFGTTTPGDNFHCGIGDDCSDDLGQNPQPPFDGVWYLYIATTYDGGLTWTTINATPGDPIQRGGICGGGTCRNLLDFFDATIDKEGRVLVGYDDGCITDGCIQGTAGNDFSAKAAIARQVHGKRMFSQFDSQAVKCPTPPPPPVCIEDNDARIAYSAGWHLINNASASGGHFRYHTGGSPNHSASLDFSIPAGSTGSITYAFAKSPKGGTADVYIDGLLRTTINYAGMVGSTQAPEFKPEYKVEFAGLAAGNHRLEIKNMSGVVYVDQFCLASSTITSQPASGPGNTSNQSGSAAAGQTTSSGYQPPSGSQEMTVTAESTLNVPFKVALVDPSGLTLQTGDAVAGIATVTVQVNQQGVYVIKVVNLSLGSIQFTTTTTPTVKR